MVRAMSEFMSHGDVGVQCTVGTGKVLKSAALSLRLALPPHTVKCTQKNIVGKGHYKASLKKKALKTWTS